MLKGCVGLGQGPGLLCDIAATVALTVATAACGGGVISLVSLTTTYALLTDPGARKTKAD